MLSMNDPKKGIGVICLTIALIVFFSCQRTEAFQPTGFPSLLSSLELSSPLTFCNEPVPLENREVRERLEKELLLSLWDRPQVILWLKRSRRYLPVIEDMLQDNGLPGDLKYVAVAESALRPHIGSPKGAIGFWQFTRETGRNYGLRIDEHIDERRNIISSTRAAIEYFSELHNMFGSWTLAAAAFNMGEQGLKAEILVQGVKDYYCLYLPLETQRFLFRILAIKLIFTDAEKYGFKLSGKDYYPPVPSEEVKLECFQEVPLRVIAKAAKTSFKAIKDLNPELRGYSLVPGTYKISIPEGSSEGFQSRFKKHLERYLQVQDERVYVVQEGDNLSSIAERFCIPLPALLILNRLDPGDPIHPGDRIIISPSTLNEDD